MRVKNKITGKLASLTLSSDEKTFLIMEDDEAVSCTVKLSDLKDWEEYERPKEYWHIDFDGSLMQTSDIKCDKSVFNKLKEIGNYFETEEEAEKAVEKLKVWKRLKDKGFKTTGLGFKDDEVGIFIRANCASNTVDELEMLFSGEDD